MPRVSRRGAGLASTLIVTLLVSILGVSLAAAVIYNLTVAARSEATVVAREQAENVVTAAMERLLKQQTFAADLAIGDSRRGGNLTFTKAVGIYHSTNNLAGDATVPGSLGRTVPPFTAHLVGYGHNGASRRIVEAMVSFPDYAFAIACEGPIRADALYVASARNATAPDDQPGHLASNNTLDPSVLLNSSSRITGDAQTCGFVKTDMTSVVEGDVRNRFDRTTVPDIDPMQYDPRKEKVTMYDMPPYIGPLPDGGGEGEPEFEAVVEGYNVTSGIAVEGNLRLDGAVILALGPLNIKGSLLGTGAILAGSTVSIGDGADFKSDNQVAILSSGNVSISGQKQKATFQGLVATQAGFSADNVKIMGAFIAAGENDPVTLRKVRAISVPQYTRIAFEVKSIMGTPILFDPMTVGFAGTMTQADFENWEGIQEGSLNSQAPVSQPPPGSVGYGDWMMSNQVFVHVNPTGTRSVSTSATPCTPGCTQTTWPHIENVVFTVLDPYGANALTQGPCPNCPTSVGYPLMESRLTDQQKDRLRFEGVDTRAEDTQLATAMPIDQAMIHIRDVLRFHVVRVHNSNHLPGDSSSLDAVLANIDAAMPALRSLLISNISRASDSDRGQGRDRDDKKRMFKFDLNEFLTPPDRLRLLLWRTL